MREKQLEIVAHWRPMSNNEYTKPFSQQGGGKKNFKGLRGQEVIMKLIFSGPLWAVKALISHIFWTAFLPNSLAF
jgi:hypothetical protein